MLDRRNKRSQLFCHRHPTIGVTSRGNQRFGRRLQRQYYISAIMPTFNLKRNVVVVGETGAGKSTVANKIAGYDCFRVSRDVLDSATAVKHTEMVCKIGDVNVAMKIMDTVGICYTRSSTTHSISNESVIRQIKSFFIKKVPEGVNLVLFVSRHGRFTDEEKRSMDYLINNFGNEISAISALVITGCDGFDEASTKQTVEDFRSDDRTKDIARFMGKGIYAVGFPDTSKMKPRMKAVTKEEMEEHANKLRNLVMSCGTMCLGEDMFEMSFWKDISQCNIL